MNDADREAVYLQKLTKKYGRNYTRPNVCNRDHSVRYIYPGRLGKVEKQKIWADIKRDDPAFAEMLQHDENIKELIDIFDAEFFIEVPKRGQHD